jgi:hypothetical protein
MTRTTDYIIVSSKFHISKTTPEDLTDTVRQKLKEGYEPLGRPFVNGEQMYQAMVKITDRAQPDSAGWPRDTGAVNDPTRRRTTAPGGGRSPTYS